MTGRVKVVCTGRGQHPPRNLGWLTAERPIATPSAEDMAAWLDNPQHTSVQTEPATALDAPEVTIAFVPWAPGSPMKQAADGDRPTIRDTFRPKCPKCGRDVPMRQETARRCFTALAENDVPELDISALR